MKRFSILLLVLLCLLSCSKKESGTVLATIDSDKITAEDFSKELDRIPPNMKMFVASEAGKKTFLDRLVMKKLLLREAQKEKIDAEKDFQDRLAEIKDQLLIEALLKKKVLTEAQVTDEEAQKFYEANKEQFKRPQEINTRQILVKTEDEAKQIQARLAKGEDFAELARSYSIDPNARSTGGEVGFQAKGTLVPEYEAAAFKLTKPKQVSGIVKTQFGYHIIRLEAIKPPSYAPFDEVKEYIKQNLAQTKQSEMIEKYVENLKKSAKITINEEALKGGEKEGVKPKEEPSKEGVKPKAETPAKEEPKAAPPQKTEAQPKK